MPFRFVRLVPVLLAAAVVLAGLGASVASATFYKTVRPTLQLHFSTKHHRLINIEGKVRLTCDDGGVYPSWPFSTDGDPVGYGPRGHFSYHRGDLTSTGETSRGLQGRVADQVVRGRLFYRLREQPGGRPPASRCWTGRSYRDPWVRFAARRQ